MKKQKYSESFYEVVRLFLGTCPSCEVGQLVEKKKPCGIFRTSQTSVTMICRRCTLHFTATWKSLAEAIGKKADSIVEDEDREKEYEFYANAFAELEKNVEIGGTYRQDIQELLRKRQLKKILKSKLK